MLRRVLSPFIAFGPIFGAVYVMDRVLSRVSPKFRILAYDLIVQPIPSAPVLPPARSRNLCARELRQGDADLEKVIAPPRVRESRFAQGAVCLATYRNERLLGYVWLCFGSYREDEARCTYEVPPGEAAFDFDLVVLPEFRMGLGFAAVWHCTTEYLRNRGVELSFSRVTHFNLISRRSHDRLGSIRIGRILILKLSGLEILISTRSPYIHLCRDPRRATIQLKYRKRLDQYTLNE